MKRYLYPVTYGWMLGMLTVWAASGNRNPVWSVLVSVVLGLACIWVTRRDQRIEQQARVVEMAITSYHPTSVKCGQCNWVYLSLDQVWDIADILPCIFCGGKMVEYY